MKENVVVLCSFEYPIYINKEIVIEETSFNF